jgi:polyhydroxybutyrate depolymerase
MSTFTWPILLLLAFDSAPLRPGNHLRSVRVGETRRTYLVHIPPSYDPQKPAPVVLAFHGAIMNGRMMAYFSGLNKKSDQAGFIVVYPNGTGRGDIFLTWNAGGIWMLANQADDVAFVNCLLDDLNRLTPIDRKRVFATGMSNGAMMAYRVAAELSERIAAIAPVAGTMAMGECKPKRPVPIMHFHGTADPLVPFGAPGKRISLFKSVEDTVKAWVRADGCPKEPMEVELPNQTQDMLPVTRKIYGPGKDGAEVVLFIIEGGGHTWPGMPPPVSWIGASTMNISANDLMWEFFQRHPLK